MPRLPKPKQLRQNTERRDIGLVAIDGGQGKVPEAPVEWLVSTRDEWIAYWASPLAQATVPGTDVSAIRRLFGLRDERERMMRVVRKERVVPGHHGQPRANPLYAQITAFDAEIRQLEDRLGLTPRSRLQLGISLGDAVRSLADINRDFEVDADAAAQADLLLAYADPGAAEHGTGGDPVDGDVPRPRARRRAG